METMCMCLWNAVPLYKQCICIMNAVLLDWRPKRMVPHIQAHIRIATAKKSFMFQNYGRYVSKKDTKLCLKFANMPQRGLITNYLCFVRLGS